MVKKEKKEFNLLNDVVIPVIAAMIIAFFLTTFVFRFAIVDGHSMEPNLHDGDFGISWIYTLYTEEIERFDIVIINNGEDKSIVKRVIALPGEHLVYSNGVLTIDGVVYEEDFIDDLAKLATGEIDIILDEDYYFCLGDNRGHSSDSRYYGPFHIDQIEANGLTILID